MCSHAIEKTSANGTGPEARVAVELSPDSARALARSIQQALEAG